MWTQSIINDPDKAKAKTSQLLTLNICLHDTLHWKYNLIIPDSITKFSQIKFSSSPPPISKLSNCLRSSQTKQVWSLKWVYCPRLYFAEHITVHFKYFCALPSCNLTINLQTTTSFTDLHMSTLTNQSGLYSIFEATYSLKYVNNQLRMLIPGIP